MATNPNFINNEEWLTQTIEDDGKVLAGLPADQHPLIKASLEHQRNYWIKRREAVRLVNKASSSSSSSYPRRPDTRNLAAARDMLSCTLPTLSPHASRVLAYIQSGVEEPLGSAVCLGVAVGGAEEAAASVGDCRGTWQVKQEWQPRELLVAEKCGEGNKKMSRGMVVGAEWSGWCWSLLLVLLVSLLCATL